MKSYAVVNVVSNSATAAHVFTDFPKAVECAAKMIHEQLADMWDEGSDFDSFLNEKREKLTRHFDFNTCFQVDGDTTVNVLTVG